jgi:hypothetical protein
VDLLVRVLRRAYHAASECMVYVFSKRKRRDILCVLDVGGKGIDIMICISNLLFVGGK